MAKGQRKRGSERQGEPEPDYKNLPLCDLRFDTPELSENFMNLRYLDDSFKGSTDNAVKLPPSNRQHGLQGISARTDVRGIEPIVLSMPWCLPWTACFRNDPTSSSSPPRHSTSN